jgi:hypothetical protein
MTFIIFCVIFIVFCNIPIQPNYWKFDDSFAFGSALLAPHLSLYCFYMRRSHRCHFFSCFEVEQHFIQYLILSFYLTIGSLLFTFSLTQGTQEMLFRLKHPNCRQRRELSVLSKYSQRLAWFFLFVSLFSAGWGERMMTIAMHIPSVHILLIPTHNICYILIWFDLIVYYYRHNVVNRFFSVVSQKQLEKHCLVWSDMSWQALEQQMQLVCHQQACFYLFFFRFQPPLLTLICVGSYSFGKLADYIGRKLGKQTHTHTHSMFFMCPIVSPSLSLCVCVS